MDLLDLIRIGFRRWYVALPAAFFVVLASLAARSATELTYKSTGSLLLFAPKDPDVSKNRLLAYNSLNVPGTVAAQVVGDQATREKLVTQGATPNYEVGLDPSNPAPLIITVATGGEKQAPLTVQLVLDEVKADLARRQEASGAPPETWITAEVVTPPTKPIPQNGSRTRAFIAVFMLGMGLAGIGVLTLDRLMERRRGGVALPVEREKDEPPPEPEATFVRPPDIRPALPLSLSPPPRPLERLHELPLPRQLPVPPGPPPAPPPAPPAGGPELGGPEVVRPEVVRPEVVRSPAPVEDGEGRSPESDAIPLLRRHPYVVAMNDDKSDDETPSRVRKFGTD